MGIIHYPFRLNPDEFENPNDYDFQTYFKTIIREFRRQKRNRRRKKLPPENLLVEATLIRRMFGLLIYIADLEERARDEKAQHKSIAESLDRDRALLDERVRLWLLWKAVRPLRNSFLETHHDPETQELLWPPDLLKKIRWKRLLHRFKEAGKIPRCIEVAIREHLRKVKRNKEASS